jgi:two-component system cell cycle sensor histidine kinase/response regulator CckA
MKSPNNHLRAHTRRCYAFDGRAVPQTAAIMAAATGLIVLAGWGLHIDMFTSVLAGLVAMNPLTAVACVLLSAALWLTVGPAISWRRYLLHGCATVVALIALSTLCDYFLGWSTGLDRLLFREALDVINAGRPNRMAPTTAVDLLLLSSAVLFLDVSTSRGRHPAQLLLVPTVLGALISVVGYVYGLTSFRDAGPFNVTALPTALAFLLLAGGAGICTA